MTGQPSNGMVRSRSSSPDASRSISVRRRHPARRLSLASPGEVKNRAKEKTQLGNIDINTATEKELTTVPGIGHVMAARIIAARPFRSADDLKKS